MGRRGSGGDATGSRGGSTPADVDYTQFMGKGQRPVPHDRVSGDALRHRASRGSWPTSSRASTGSPITAASSRLASIAASSCRHALELLPADYWRYYLLANAPESDDADFTWDLFASTVNEDLVGVFGNFVNRTVKLAASRFGGRVPAGGDAGALEQRLYAELNERVGALQRHYSTTVRSGQGAAGTARAVDGRERLPRRGGAVEERPGACGRRDARVAQPRGACSRSSPSR